MNYFFQSNFVAIVRKKGDEFFTESINTYRVLPEAGISDTTVRKNVIARLRKDPSVIFVLEGRDGLCEETVDLKDSLLMKLSIDGTDRFRGKIIIYCHGDEVYRDNVLPEDVLTGSDAEEKDYEAWRTFLYRVTSLLTDIEMGDYSFIPDDCPYFETVEPGDSIDFFDAIKILKENGYEMEPVHVVNYVLKPCLFVDENDVIMLGTTHFQGDEPFLELKRMFYGNTPEHVRDALRQVSSEQGAIRVIEWEDGSWSFRVLMDADLTTDNFMDRLRADLSKIRSFIEKVEEILGEEPWPIIKEQRQLFIYEVIDSSIKLSHLKI